MFLSYYHNFIIILSILNFIDGIKDGINVVALRGVTSLKLKDTLDSLFVDCEVIGLWQEHQELKWRILWYPKLTLKLVFSMNFKWVFNRLKWTQLILMYGELSLMVELGRY